MIDSGYLVHKLLPFVGVWYAGYCKWSKRWKFLCYKYCHLFAEGTTLVTANGLRSPTDTICVREGSVILRARGHLDQQYEITIVELQFWIEPYLCYSSTWSTHLATKGSWLRREIDEGFEDEKENPPRKCCAGSVTIKFKVTQRYEAWPQHQFWPGKTVTIFSNKTLLISSEVKQWAFSTWWKFETLTSITDRSHRGALGFFWRPKWSFHTWNVCQTI